MKKEYCIITDPSCELLKEEQRTLKIGGMVPLHVLYNQAPLTLTAEAVYAKMENGEITAQSVSTSSCSPLEALEAFESVHESLPPNVTIAYIGISGELSSGTVSAINLAADEFRELHPERELLIIPSYCISNGLGLLLHYAAEYEGDQLENYVELVGSHVAHLFTIKDLSFALSGGRFGNLAANMVKAGQKLSGLSPLMYFPSDNKLQLGRAYRYRKVVDHWIEYYKRFADPEFPYVRIGYTGMESRGIADKLITRFIENGVASEHIQLVPVGPVVGAHVGPTCISVFFVQQEVRDTEWHKLHY